MIANVIRNRIAGVLPGALAALALALAAPLAWAQDAKNAVESINFSSIQGGKILVKIGLKEPLKALPQSFAVTNPARIAIDLPETTSALARNQVEAGEGDLKSVSVVQTANRTRLVMNLARSLIYTASLEGNLLVVTIDGSQSPSTSTSAGTSPAAASTSNSAAQLPTPGTIAAAVPAHIALYDAELALRQAAGKPELAREMLELLLASLPETQTLLAQANDLPTIELQAGIHKLAGGAAYCGMPALQALCHQLESALRRGATAETLEPELLELQDLLLQIQTLVRPQGT